MGANSADDAALANVHDRLVAGGDLDDDERRMVDLTLEVATDPTTVTLPDGRELGYADVGDPTGDPIVVLHGFPNARTFGALFDAAGREHGVRVLTPERPGFGISDPDPGRTPSGYAADLDAFADEFDLGSFPLLGVSGGGPYALAAVAELDRIERAGVAVGVGPMSAVGLRERVPYYLARFLPPLVRYSLRGDVDAAVEDPWAPIEERVAETSPADADYWRGGIGRALVLNHLEAARHNGVGPLVEELATYGRPWDVDLEAIDVPVAMWYGEDDRIVPAGMGRHLADRVPTADATFYEGLGHLSTVVENEDAVVGALVD